MEPVLLVVAGGVLLTLAAVFVYAVVLPSRRLDVEPSEPFRHGRECVYCHSTRTRRISQEPRYDDHGFALVTGYECVKCGLPFWSVERARQQQHHSV